MEQAYFCELLQEAENVLKVAMRFKNIYELTNRQMSFYKKATLIEDKKYLPVLENMDLLKAVYRISYNKAFNYQEHPTNETISCYRRIYNYLRQLMIKNNLLEANKEFSARQFVPVNYLDLFQHKSFDNVFFRKRIFYDVDKKEQITCSIKNSFPSDELEGSDSENVFLTTKARLGVLFQTINPEEQSFVLSNLMKAFKKQAAFVKKEYASIGIILLDPENNSPLSIFSKASMIKEEIKKKIKEIEQDGNKAHFLEILFQALQDINAIIYYYNTYIFLNSLTESKILKKFRKEL